MCSWPPIARWKNYSAVIWFPKASLRNRIGNKAGVPGVPNALAEISDYAQLMKVADKAGLGKDLVLQSAYGDSGYTTFFTKSEAEFRKHQHDIVGQGEIKVMKRINCRGAPGGTRRWR